jgi:putative CocE/NonD family hydrolase
MRIRSSVLSFAICLTAWAQPYQVKVENNVPATMRDGVVLMADVYRPMADGKFPVLLQRTPYNRTGGSGAHVDVASHGYVVIVQDTRGRYQSQGTFYPFRYESQDGYDTVEWAAALPYSNGQVGMFGGSYVGATQMLASIARPPHLVSIFPYVTASEYYEGWTYQGGALMQWFTSSWATGLAVDTVTRQVAETGDAKSWMTQLPVDAYRLIALPGAGVAPYFRDWVAHERDDDYWRPWKISDHYGEMTVKALHSGGWYDLFLKGTIQNFIGMRRTSPSSAGQRLLLGPWGHTNTSPEGKIGDWVFGKQAVLDFNQILLNWADYSLKGVQNEYATGAPVRIFVMGENVWRDEQEFPLARTQYTNYYLHHGALSTASPAAEETPEAYEYDPANAVPTIGGRLCCGNNQLPPGPADQRPNEGRPDVVVFSTPPLEKDIEVTGFIHAKIYAESSAVDTDFTAMLTDVEPSGYSRLLTDGIVRARYRNSTAKAEPIEPGKIYEYDIDLWATSNVFKAGHRIRLAISSSNFPRFDRNLNTGEPALGATRMVKAQQKLYHDTAHPSALVLPVIPR